MDNYSLQTMWVHFATAAMGTLASVNLGLRGSSAADNCDFTDETTYALTPTNETYTPTITIPTAQSRCRVEPTVNPFKHLVE